MAVRAKEKNKAGSTKGEKEVYLCSWRGVERMIKF